MMALAWAVHGFTVQVLIAWRFPFLVGTGRILSRPLWRFRLFAPLVGYTMLITSKTRAVQMLLLCLLYIPSSLVLGGPLWLTASFWVVVIAWYADDYYTGDDERWQRFLKRWKRWRLRRRALRHPSPA